MPQLIYGGKKKKNNASARKEKKKVISNEEIFAMRNSIVVDSWEDAASKRATYRAPLTFFLALVDITDISTLICPGRLWELAYPHTSKSDVSTGFMADFYKELILSCAEQMALKVDEQVDLLAREVDHLCMQEKQRRVHVGSVVSRIIQEVIHKKSMDHSRWWARSQALSAAIESGDLQKALDVLRSEDFAAIRSLDGNLIEIYFVYGRSLVLPDCELKSLFLSIPQLRTETDPRITVEKSDVVFVYAGSSEENKKTAKTKIQVELKKKGSVTIPSSDTQREVLFNLMTS